MATTASPNPSGKPRPREHETTFTRNLRYEWASEEGRALVGSYAISTAIGIAWILLVIFGPKTRELELLPETERVAIDFTLDPPAPEPAPTPVAATPSPAERTPSPGPTNRRPGPTGPERGNPRPGNPGSRTETNRAGAIGDAFGTGSGSGTGGVVGDVSGILRGVAVNSGSGGTGGGRGGSGGGGLGGKTVLGYGEGGQGSRTPGRGGIGGGSGTGGGGGGGIGGVGGGGGMTRAAVRVAAPSVIAAPALGGPGRDVSDLGTFVRSREPQLRFCYQEYGLKQNPNLAGSVSVGITIAGSGAVENVAFRGGSLTDSEVRSCIRERISGWKFPASSSGAGTYGFSFNFTK